MNTSHSDLAPTGGNPIVEGSVVSCNTISARETKHELCALYLHSEILSPAPVIRYFDQQEMFVDMMLECSEVEENVIISNLLTEEIIYSGNRFVIYALFPEQNVDVRIMWGKQRQNVVIACGHSILNRTCQTDIGSLMLKYGGGGHTMVGTCQLPVDAWEDALKDIVKTLVETG